MKQIYKVLFFISGLASAFAIFIYNDSKEVFIESEQSKTITGHPVFNKIKFISTADKDIWMMNQSHFGAKADSDKWDRLAIVVDKTKSPKQARFYQFESGELNWSENLKEKSFKVSCYMCHSNGPRAIRPNKFSADATLDLKSRLKIFFWNLKIKSYGPTVANSEHDKLDSKLIVPFKLHSNYENEKLQVKTCLRCHNQDGLFSRNFLTRQNLPSIRFMIDNGYMPPLGFSLSKQDQIALQKFINGF